MMVFAEFVDFFFFYAENPLELSIRKSSLLRSTKERKMSCVESRNL